MIRMAKIGDLVIVLRGGTQASGNGKGNYTAKWNFGINPLGQITRVKRYWDRHARRHRTSYYSVTPVDTNAGFGSHIFYAKELRRPTVAEVQTAVASGLIRRPVQ